MGGCSCISVIVNTIEAGFYRWGKLIAKQPWVGVLVPIILTVALVPVSILKYNIIFTRLRLRTLNIFIGLMLKAFIGDFILQGHLV